MLMPGNVGAGGNDPVRAAATQNLVGTPRQVPHTGGPQPGIQAPAAAPPVGSPPAGNPQVGNEVAFHLSNAFEALLRTGPTDENLAALEQFRSSLTQLAPNGGGGGPQQPVPGPPGRQVPVPNPPSPIQPMSAPTGQVGGVPLPAMS